MYAVLGDEDALKAIRTETPHKSHCRWLRRDANACMALPAASGIAEDKVGGVCPHNVYEQDPELFAARDVQAPALMHLFRMLKSAELGVLQESDMDPVSLTELIAARAGIDQIQRDNQEREETQRRAEMVRPNTR